MSVGNTMQNTRSIGYLGSGHIWTSDETMETGGLTFY